MFDYIITLDDDFRAACCFSYATATLSLMLPYETYGFAGVTQHATARSAVYDYTALQRRLLLR